MASSDDEDEDLKQAIAMSLQESTTEGAGRTAHEAIILDSDSETEERSARVASHAKVEEWLLVSKIGQGLLGLDRKRNPPSISPPPPRKRLKTVTRDQTVQSMPGTETITTASQATATSRASCSSIGKGPVFLTGTVKKTWAFGHERKGDDVKLEEVLQRDDLNLAVLSSFQWDIDWLLAKINSRNTQITLVMQAKDQATQEQYRRETATMSKLRLCFPSMEGQISCMHSKLMLLSYPSHLRVAVPTANLVSYDWGETGIVRLFRSENRLICI